MEENKIYQFTAKVEYEKFYSEESCYGAYNVTTTEDIPYGKLYKGFSNENNTQKIYFLNLAGKMQRLYVGCCYTIEATASFNQKYNCWQYTPINIIIIKPSTIEGSSKFLKTIITDKQADSLLSVYPDIIDMVLDDEYIDLSDVKGVKEKTFDKIKDKILSSYGLADLLVMLQPLGVTLKMIKKISNLDKNISLVKEQIKRNPYILTKIKGLGFKKVDGMAVKINPDIKVSKERVLSFLNYYFEELGSNTGDTWCDINNLKQDVSNSIIECYDIFTNLFKEEKEKPTILQVINEKQVGLLRYYNNEMEVFNLLNKINKFSINYSDKIDINKQLEKTEERLGFQFTKEQYNAITSTLHNGVTLITAKGGTGKTTSINGIIDLYNNCSIALCSLSAKASRRMTESTGQSAQTIHTLLGYGKSKEYEFLYNQYNKLKQDIIIIDEASMINVDIFLNLLKAIKPTSKIVIVFDTAQLPPIGYGNIATDLLKSKFNICKLTKVHRQAAKSGILMDANKIREQMFPITSPNKKEIHGELSDMCYMFRNDRQQIQDILINSYLRYIKKIGVENTVIIVPRKQDCINSTREINKVIQDKLISNNVPSINRGDTIFKIGARIIQKANIKEKEVINGELGYITKIVKKPTKDGKLKEFFYVKFDNGKEVEFERDDLKTIELGYAITIHSSQGSEYNTVLIGLDCTHFSLLSCNLLYTAITRAKQKCLLVSEPRAFQISIRKRMNRRNTFLRNLLK